MYAASNGPEVPIRTCRIFAARAFTLAAKYSHEEIARLLLEAGADEDVHSIT